MLPHLWGKGLRKALHVKLCSLETLVIQALQTLVQRLNQLTKLLLTSAAAFQASQSESIWLDVSVTISSFYYSAQRRSRSELYRRLSERVVAAKPR